MNKNEIRLFDNMEFRAEQDGDKKFISGYALKFGTESKDLGGFIETIERSALDGADMSDVVALFNHKSDYVLARKSDTADTLELEVDEVGLKYRFEVDEEISYVKDLYRNIKKGNISKSSFAFRIDEGGDKWEKRSDGKYLRTITKFKGIYDVSPVTVPAYNDTVSLVRSFDEIKKELDGEEIILPKEISKVNENKLKYVGVISK
jgi:uncharacterized protein